jgi:hypothetical protein
LSSLRPSAFWPGQSIRSHARLTSPVNESTLPSASMPPPTPPAPNMVKVLPEPVCPYANTHTLKPSMVDWISCCVSLNTFSCVLPASVVPANTESKSHDLRKEW